MPDSDVNIFEDDDEISEADLPKRLRAKIKELNSRVSEMEQENQSLKSEKRSRVLTETLATKGLNPGIAKFIPADLDDEGVDSWLSENAGLFSGGQTQESPQQAVIARDAEQAQAIRRMAATDSGLAGAPDMQSVMAGIENAQSMDELMQAIRQA